MIKSAKDAYKEYHQSIQTPLIEYGKYWRGLFQSFGFTVTDYDDVDMLDWHNSVYFKIQKCGGTQTYYVYYSPAHFQGIKIYIGNVYTQVAKCMSETGAIKFIKSIP